MALFSSSTIALATSISPRRVTTLARRRSGLSRRRNGNGKKVGTPTGSALFTQATVSRRRQRSRAGDGTTLRAPEVGIKIFVPDYGTAGDQS